MKHANYHPPLNISESQTLHTNPQNDLNINVKFTLKGIE